MAHERRNIHLAIYKQTENEPKNEKQGKILQKPRLKMNKLEQLQDCSVFPQIQSQTQKTSSNRLFIRLCICL
jgi:hypothetical protein